MCCSAVTDPQNPVTPSLLSFRSGVCRLRIRGHLRVFYPSIVAPAGLLSARNQLNWLFKCRWWQTPAFFFFKVIIYISSVKFCLNFSTHFQSRLLFWNYNTYTDVSRSLRFVVDVTCVVQFDSEDRC